MPPRRRMAAVGEVVGLTYDSREVVARGDYVRTTTGRTYKVRRATLAQTGKHAGSRWTLEVEVLGFVPSWEADLATLENGRVVHQLRWYRRGRRRAGGR